MATLDLKNLVLNDINVETVTNNTDTGIFDKLMESVNKNIEYQYDGGRITSSDYANVYLSSLQAVLSQSVQFALQEQLTEIQIASAMADLTLKEKQIEVADTELALKQYELANILPEQVIKLQEEIDLLQTQDSEILLDGVKKRLLLDEQTETEGLQQNLLVIDAQIKSANKDEILDSTVRANTQLDDALLTSTKQRLIMDEELETADLQQIILGTEEELKTAQKDEVLQSTVRSDNQLADSLLTTAKQRLVLDEEVETANLEQVVLGVEEDVKTAQHLEIVDSTLRANTKLSDDLVTADKQRNLMSVDTVLKDKQASKLGLDNTMKNSEAARNADANFVYTPHYI